jgi:hypothetical protein
MKLQLVSFLLGAVLGLLAATWITARKIEELRDALFWLSPPRSRHL